MNKVFTLLASLNAFSKRSPKIAFVLVLLVLLIGSKIGNAINPDTSQPKGFDAVEVVDAPVEERVDYTTPVRVYLRNNLNDWDSYDSEGYGEPVEIGPHNGNKAWSVVHEYRAKNGFGGVILNRTIFYFTKEDGVYNTMQVR
jgi:hypothetical protein